MAVRHFLIPLAIVAGAVTLVRPAQAERTVLAPLPALSIAPTANREVAIFAGGCFWGVEGVFEHVRGVTGAVSGYTGGQTERPTYDAVSGGSTGHAEAVRVTYDPRVVRYTDLLRIYFSVVADPTMLNAQGPDRGTQYRTALFPTSAAQEKQARAYIAQLRNQRIFERPIVTKIESLRGFMTAETYHQDYMKKNPNAGYIVANDRPKVEALKRLFPKSYRG
ncbi:MAG: peptide-methionine (S)-S-oxide reductase MsrA [Sphingomonas bacterium]|nr:peptide-methionine (S)-S-oxide reductase MsrA [Sphingomonas bacterium]